MATRTVSTTSAPISGSQPEDGPRRRRLLHAALELFAERGVEATSLRMVAARAGSSLGALSHYYPSKAALAAATHRWVLDRMRRALDDAVATAKVPAEGGVNAMAHLALSRRDAYYQLLRDEPAMAAYLRREWLRGGTSGGFAAAELAMDEQERQAFLTRDFPHPPRDPEVSLLLHRLIGMIPLLFAPVIEETLGIDVMTPSGIRRWHAAELELLLGPGGAVDLDPGPPPTAPRQRGAPVETRKATS